MPVFMFISDNIGEFKAMMTLNHWKNKCHFARCIQCTLLSHVSINNAIKSSAANLKTYVNMGNATDQY
jgi:hypothetical protein